MVYPKEVMKTSELMKMGFPRGFLDRAYRSPGQTFAWTENPAAATSPRLYETKGFERWRQEQMRLERMARQA